MDGGIAEHGSGRRAARSPSPWPRPRGGAPHQRDRPNGDVRRASPDRSRRLAADARDLTLGVGRLGLVELELAFEKVEFAPHRGDHHVLGREEDVSVGGVDLPGARGSSLGTGSWRRNGTAVGAVNSLRPASDDRSADHSAAGVLGRARPLDDRSSDSGVRGSA